MVTNYYNASNNYSSPVKRSEPKPYSEVPVTMHSSRKKIDIKSTDNVILLGLLAVLYLTECDDKWLMIALLFLVFS